MLYFGNSWSFSFKRRFPLPSLLSIVKKISVSIQLFASMLRIEITGSVCPCRTCDLIKPCNCSKDELYWGDDQDIDLFELFKIKNFIPKYRLDNNI